MKFNEILIKILLNFTKTVVSPCPTIITILTINSKRKFFPFSDMMFNITVAIFQDIKQFMLLDMTRVNRMESYLVYRHERCALKPT